MSGVRIDVLGVRPKRRRPGRGERACLGEGEFLPEDGRRRLSEEDEEVGETCLRKR